MKVLIVGASGMLGHTLFNHLSQREELDVFGTLKSMQVTQHLHADYSNNIFSDCYVENQDCWRVVFENYRPEVVINCIGVVKQSDLIDNEVRTMHINGVFPHRLATLAALYGSRLIHISTDCVFSGSKGDYKEEDIPDASDLYGVSKYIGEPHYDHCLTIRTSIIGPELSHGTGLLHWFLNNGPSISGYTNAIFSGLPTVELANLITDKILPDTSLKGVFHVGSQPISKFELLTLIKKQYRTNHKINPNGDLAIDRSLNSSKFTEATGYFSPTWPILIERMKQG